MLRIPELRERVVQAMVRMARYQPSERTRRILLAVAAVLFLTVTALAFPRIVRLKLDPRWVLVAVGAALFTPVLNATEYWLAGRWVNVDVSPIEGFRVTVLASAANLAPVPGAVLVRGRELYSRGGDGADVTRSLAAIGAAWVSVSLLVAGVAIAGLGRLRVAMMFVGASALCLVALAMVVPRRTGNAAVLTQVLPLELASVAVQGVRIYAVFQALGITVSPLQAVAFPAAGAVASAIGLFPGGLGLAELLAGGVAPLIGLAPSVGVVGAAGDRVVGLGILALLSATLTVLGWCGYQE